MKLLKKYPSVLVLLLSTIILFIYFHAVIFHPGDYLFGPGGDGLKNYYTLAYYVKYDHGTLFTGMNYPYGEHMVFTDNQPLLAMTLKFINTHLFKVEDHTHAIINLLMLFSIPVTCLFIFGILRFYKLPVLYSTLVSTALGFLSPQMQRLTGHYALSYMFFVPMIWYCMLRIYEGGKLLKWTVLISIISTAFTFIHLYYALISGAFLMSFLFISLISKKPAASSYLKSIVAYLICAIVPFIALQVFMRLTDHITDRPGNPYGIYDYKASFESVFLPSFGPILGLIEKVIKVRHPSWEGIAYIGITGSFVFVVSLAMMVRYFIKGKWRKGIQGSLPNSLFVSLWAAVLVLLFSMAFPFRLHMEFLLDWVPQFKQFRSLGRMAWVFYYVFTVFSAYTIYKWYRLARLNGIRSDAILIGSVLVAAWFVDARINVLDRRNVILDSRDGQAFFNPQNSLAKRFAEHHIDPKDFQAVLSFPFFCIGSEILWIDGTGASSGIAMKASYDLHMPVATGMVSRTSRQQAFKMAQLLSSDLIDKPILKEYDNDKPLLLITTDEMKSEREKKLILRADSLFKIDNKTFYRLPLKTFNTIAPALREFLDTPSIGVYDSTLHLISSSYKGVVISEKAGTYNDKTREETFFDEILPDAIDTSYEASVWLQIDKDFTGFPTFYLEQYGADGTQVERQEVAPKFITDVYQDQLRVAFRFKLMNKGNRLKIYSLGKECEAHSLRIIPKGYFVVEKDGENRILNNYMVPAKLY